MASIKAEKEKRTFNQRFYIKKRISAGSFGVVFLAEDSQASGYAALKVEKEEGDNLMSLKRETQILEAIQFVSGVPRLLWSGFDHGYNCLALQLLGRDLSYYLKQFRKFTIKCICNIGDQLISILENVHNRGVIHRDIKPENILAGRNNELNQLYLVDYGISKFYKGSDGQHIPQLEGKPFIGTTRYASIGAHRGIELSRRDDLESLGYVLVFLLKGSLPWQNVQCSTDKERTKQIGRMKIEFEQGDLWKELPLEMQRYFDYVKKLSFKATPDYTYLQQIIQRLATSNGVMIDKKFDWLEPGTTTTKSIDTLRGPRMLSNSRPPSSKVSQDNKRSSDKKSSFNDIQGSSLFSSQGDFLKLPKNQRADSKKRSDNSSNSYEKSQQSSVKIKYNGSIYKKQNSNSSILQTMKQKNPVFQQHMRQSNYYQSNPLEDNLDMESPQKRSSISSKFVQKSEFAQQSQVNPLFHVQENFQDLEALEGRLRRDSLAYPKEIKSKKNIGEIVVKQVQKQQQEQGPQQENTQLVWEDQMDDTNTLSNKVQQLQLPQKHFKQWLSKK